MVNITINDKKIEVNEGKTVLQAALDNGIFVPHYCWHPTLSVSGNCRMCLVEIVGRPKLEVSCNLPVVEGMVVLTESEAVKKARQDVLEFLLINHPLDCPICDQAGECLLQDYHFKYSLKKGRFKEEKVVKSKAVDIGPHIKLDNERCIVCSRCVRFCAEIAKDPQLSVTQRGDRSFITTAPGRSLDNPYSLNTVDLCPVGALTSKGFRFKKRVWFLHTTESVCPSCSNGCPVWLDHEGQMIYRMRPREQEIGISGDRDIRQKYVAESQLPIRTILCDEGRLSFERYQQETRFDCPVIATEHGTLPVGVEEAVSLAKKALSRFKDVVCIISAHSSCEEVDAAGAAFSQKIYRTERTVAEPTEDVIIRKRDKNPNTKYLKDRRITSVPIDVRGDALIVIGELAQDDMMKVVGFEWKIIIHIVHDRTLVIPGADIVLPLATFAEKEGSFVNFEGKKRIFKRAVQPKGSSMGADLWIRLLGE